MKIKNGGKGEVFNKNIIYFTGDELCITDSKKCSFLAITEGGLIIPIISKDSMTGSEDTIETEDKKGVQVKIKTEDTPQSVLAAMTLSLTTEDNSLSKLMLLNFNEYLSSIAETDEQGKTNAE